MFEPQTAATAKDIDAVSLPPFPAYRQEICGGNDIFENPVRHTEGAAVRIGHKRAVPSTPDYLKPRGDSLDAAVHYPEYTAAGRDNLP